MWDTVFPTNAHETHQLPDALLVHGMAFVPQVPGHLPNTGERRVEELLVDFEHQAEVGIRFAHRAVIERRSGDRQQAALCAD